jgi:hypothetical protein
MNEEWGQIAANSIAHAAERSMINIDQVFQEWRRPSVLFRPRLSIDGNQWMALYGENLQDGVAGFGDSPELAMFDFDFQWHKRLPGDSNEH